MVTEAEVRVGGEIPSICGARLCKCERLHIVIAKVGDKVVKAQCKVCNAVHRYRSPDKTKRAARSRAASKTKTPRAPKKPVAKVEADMSLPVRKYAMADSYTVAERIQHPKFGEGVVEESKTGKITVFFAESGERKVLIVDRP